MMTKYKLFIILITIFILLFLIIALGGYHFLQHYGPFAPAFCDQYKDKVDNKYAELIRKLNNYSTCRRPEDDIFDYYIYWKDEVLGGVFDNILVFKGSDTRQDWTYNLTPHVGNRIFNGIGLIYKDIKLEIFNVIDKYNITTLTGWSLGAILSCMCGLETSHRINNVVLFGLPNIFNSNFITEYNDKLGSKTIVYNHNYDVVVNAFGYGKARQEIGSTKWIDAPIMETSKLFSHGFGYYHVHYLKAK